MKGWYRLAKSKKRLSETMKTLLQTKQEVFEKLVLDFHELYKLGRFTMVFVGPGASAGISEEDERVLIKKYDLSKRKLSDIITSILSCVHFVLFDEVEAVSSRLEKKDSENFKKKASFISQIVERDPAIKNSFYAYSSSKIPFYAGMDWEAEIKVFHSPHDYLAKLPTLPIGRIQIHTLSSKEYPPKGDSVEFEITLKDVENLIRYLGDLRKALENLTTAKVIPGE